MLFADQSAIFWSTTSKLIVPRKFNEQRMFNNENTVICHFCKRLLWTPYPRIRNYKQWHIDKVHKELKCHAFDDDLNEYIEWKERFENVRFDLYINQQPSTTATQSLYNIGILIEEQNLDKETGGLKKEVLDKNKKNYELSQKIFRWSIGVGTIAGFLFAIIFGTINPNSYLFLIGVVLGIGSAAATNYGMKYYYKNKEINSEKSSITRQTNKNENAGRNISYLKQLYDDGVISKEEYQEKSKKILDKNGK